MISDEELSELPVDPELAFVRFEKIMRARVQTEEQHAHQIESDPDAYRLEYMNKIAAAVQVFRIEALSNLSVPSAAGHRGNVHDQYREFTREVDFVTIQIRIRSAQTNRQGSVGLDSTSRAKIHHFIKQIREVIENAHLPQDKRDALFGKLNDFAAEIDRSRTRLQVLAAVSIAVCHTIGEGFEKLEPARKWIDSIARVFGQAKEWEDRADNRLPHSLERKRLEPPPDIPPVDDDIPF